MMTQMHICCIFSSTYACGLASLLLELLRFPGILLILCFVLQQCLPAPFALGLLLHHFPFPSLFSCVLKLLKLFSLPSFLQLCLLSCHLQALILYLWKRKNCCTLIPPYTHRLWRSRPPSLGRPRFVWWAQQGTGYQATVLLGQTYW